MQLNRNPALGKHLSLQSWNWMKYMLQKEKGAATVGQPWKGRAQGPLCLGALLPTSAEEASSGIHRHTRPQFWVSLSKEK